MRDEDGDGSITLRPFYNRRRLHFALLGNILESAFEARVFKQRGKLISQLRCFDI